jgi:hypothetical protein
MAERLDTITTAAIRLPHPCECHCGCTGWIFSDRDICYACSKLEDGHQKPWVPSWKRPKTEA